MRSTDDLMFSPHANMPRLKSATIDRKRQRGVAIITALLIVTIAATISVTIATQLQLDVRRTSNLIAKDQASYYLFAAEEWSQRILRDDKKDNNTDDLTEAWAIELPPIPVAGGSIQGKLTDLHSCLNVNSLVAGNPTTGVAGGGTGNGTNPTNTSATKSNSINTITEARLKQLFTNLKIDNTLTQAIADWIDSDLNTSNPNGAEDGYYLNLAKPYHTANTPLQSISELRLIKGFQNSKIYYKVKDYLCAFTPLTGDAAINVNTASAEVLKSLSPKMTDILAKDIIDRRKDKPFKDVKEFTSFAKLATIITNTNLLTTSSEYFLLRTQARIGQANRIMYSIIYRDNSGKTAIIWRSMRTL